MKVGVFAKTFSGNQPDQVLKACKVAGFSAVQYNMSCSGLASLPSSISGTAVQAISDAATKHNVQISAVSATYNMTDPDLERRKAGRLGFATIAANATKMGTNLLTVCSGSLDAEDQWRFHPANKDPESWRQMCREFEILLDHADQNDILIGVEPEHANIVSSSKKARQLLDTFSGSRIRIVLDPANLVETALPSQQNDIINEALDLLGPEIALAHAKDRYADGRVAPAGRGIVDWSHLLSGLTQLGFAGPLIAHGITQEEAPAVANYLSCQLEQL